MINKKSIRKLISSNSLFLRILLTTIVSIIIFSLIIVSLSIYIAQAQFINAYAVANQKVLTQINSDYDRINQDIINVLSVCDNSYYVHDYLVGDYSSDIEETQTIYNMKNQLTEAINATNNLNVSNLILIGTNGNQFINKRDALLSDEIENFMKQDFIAEVYAEPNKVKFQFIEKGLTDATSSEPCNIAVKALVDIETDEVYGVALILMTEEEVSNIYTNLIDVSINTCFILNQDGLIISSNNKTYLNTIIPDFYENAERLYESDSLFENVQFNNESISIYSNKMSFPDFYLISSVNNTVLLNDNFDTNIFLLTIAICLVLFSVVLFFIIRATTHPLSKLAEKMPEIANGDFSQGYIDVSGSGEVKELALAYNSMLDGLNDYVNRLVCLEEEKRLSEIKTLQMQIHPHFMYNTLTCIKFLIWQNDVDKSITTLDAFIQLLRNTISDQRDIISVKEEIDNLKNYVYIQTIRNGEKVKVTYNIDEKCNNYAIPKLLLQPFVENAFFHAFTEQEKGKISLFIRQKNDVMTCEIMDNGKGMTQGQIEELWKNKGKSSSDKSHGIGVKNVNNRVRLIYGDDYGVVIKSNFKVGTIITITIPAIPLEDN